MPNKNNISTNESSALEQYQHIVDETNIVSKTDLKGIITYVNSKFLAISGYTEEELIGRPHNIVRDPDNPSSLYKDMWTTIKSKKDWHGIVSNLRKDGTKYTVDASIFPILDSDGEIVEYISIRHDITKVLELSNKLKDINQYIQEQEYIAKKKIEAGIINNLSDNANTILYKPCDILSGDLYSIYKLNDGSIFLYLIDGQGHGISPALTVFSVSSLVNQFVYKMRTMERLIKTLYPSIRIFLDEIEQLSYTMIMISPDKKSLKYCSGGMYPFLIKKGDEIIKVKANNTPFMNFSPTPVLKEIDIDNWDSLIVYSDGIVEHENKELKDYTPESMINNPTIMKNSMSEIYQHDFEDDVTVIHLKNI